MEPALIAALSAAIPMLWIGLVIVAIIIAGRGSTHSPVGKYQHAFWALFVVTGLAHVIRAGLIG
jgi:hypothetical protein